jgi:hypothetical protein
MQHSKVALVMRDLPSYDAVRTPMDLPIAQEVIRAVESARGSVVLLPTMGWECPIGSDGARSTSAYDYRSDRQL